MIRLLPALMLVTACGASAAEEARGALGTAARALVIVDQTFADEYERARVEARETSSTWDERDAKVAKWETARDALRASRSSLLAAEAAIDAYESDEAGDWLGQAVCVASSLSHLRAAFRDVGISVPPFVSRAEATLNGLSARCDRRMVFGPGSEAEGRSDP